jgi:hypothetical protein
MLFFCEGQPVAPVSSPNEVTLPDWLAFQIRLLFARGRRKINARASRD